MDVVSYRELLRYRRGAIRRTNAAARNTHAECEQAMGGDRRAPSVERARYRPAGIVVAHGCGPWSPNGGADRYDEEPQSRLSRLPEHTGCVLRTIRPPEGRADYSGVNAITRVTGVTRIRLAGARASRARAPM